MDATCQHILTAEQNINRMQQDQLRWAETSPEAAAALHAARTRAVLKVAARMNATTEELDYLRLVVADAWSVEGERTGMLLEHFDKSLEEFSCGEQETYSRLTCTLYVVLDLWPDVVAETDTWARRYASTQE